MYEENNAQLTGSYVKVTGTPSLVGYATESYVDDYALLKDNVNYVKASYLDNMRLAYPSDPKFVTCRSSTKNSESSFILLEN